MPRAIEAALALLACVACRERARAPASDGGTVPPTRPLPSVARWSPLPDGTSFLAVLTRGEDDRSCAVSRDGRVACWGDLGGEGPGRLLTGVPHLLDGVDDVVDLVSFGSEVCVVRRDGSGGCIAVRYRAAVPTFPHPVAELENGLSEVCVRTLDGRVGCFRDVDEAPTGAATFVAIAGVSGATELTCVPGSCCVVSPSGVSCFGAASPEVGIAESEDARRIGVDLPPATQIAYTSSGACVRTASGGAHCWGNAARLSTPAGVRAVTTFNGDICVLGDDGQLRCNERTPSIAAVVDAERECLTTADGAAYCLGANGAGELGDGRPTMVPTPHRVPDLDHVVDLRVANTEVCALREDRSLRCWGWAPPAELGPVTGPLGRGDDPTCWIAPRGTLACHAATFLRMPRDRRTANLDKPRIRTFAMGSNDTVCVVDAARRLACTSDVWRIDPEWIQVTDEPVAEVDDFGIGFCARLVDGRVGCFRERSDDELTGASLRLVPGIDDAIQLSSGPDRACALGKRGDVHCWTEAEPDPRPIPALKGATSISTHAHHSCALVQSEILCIGDNADGQLGNGSPTDPTDTPVRANLPHKALLVGVGGSSTCALDDRAHVWCWGSDKYGQLGLGRPTESAVPLKVVHLGPPAPTGP